MYTSRTIAKYLLQSVLLWSCIATPGLAGDNLKVQLILSDGNAPYQSFARTFRQNLPANIQLSVVERAEDYSALSPTADLLVTVGVKAAERVATGTRTPLLAAMIPSQTYATLLAKRPSGSQTSAIFLDQPLGRQVDLLQAALPGRKKIGVMHTSDTRLNMMPLRKELENHGYTLTDQTLQDDGSLFAELEALLTRSDVLLAIPDSAIYNAHNIRNILLSSYRHGVPLVGFSPSYVQAGALCAIYSTPEQLAAQASATSLSYAQSRRLPDAKYPDLYAIAVNQEVARALGISIATPELLQLQIGKPQGETR